mmetsp:Transcript_17429/g.29421  ORF Transcript_17429/g.29421 Transcript_17429/m.29421 type:complete len:144 (+) Transcript_17429:189-620(+)
MYLQLFIINRSGGLVYNKNLSPAAPNLTTNDCLRLGSTFHGLHAIAPQIAPVISAGIERLETDMFVLQSLQTLTGTKFVITATPGTVELILLLQGIYEIYSDYVLKNPFYEMEMPIRCDLFNRHLDKLIAKTIAAAQSKRRQS